jgi:alpha-mannosidase
MNGKVIFDEKTNTVRTEKLSIEFDKDTGLIKQIADTKSNRKFLKADGNIFELYEDRPCNWPAWDIQLFHKEMKLESPKLTKFEFKDKVQFAALSQIRVMSVSRLNKKMGMLPESDYEFPQSVPYT